MKERRNNALWICWCSNTLDLRGRRIVKSRWSNDLSYRSREDEQARPGGCSLGSATWSQSSFSDVTTAGGELSDDYAIGSTPTGITQTAGQLSITGKGRSSTDSSIGVTQTLGQVSISSNGTSLTDERVSDPHSHMTVLKLDNRQRRFYKAFPISMLAWRDLRSKPLPQNRSMTCIHSIACGIV